MADFCAYETVFESSSAQNPRASGGVQVRPPERTRDSFYLILGVETSRCVPEAGQSIDHPRWPTRER